MNLSAFPWSRLFRLSLATAALAASAQASAELVLYEDDDYSGRPYRAYAPVNNLAQVNFNDKASSVVVRSGAWQLCGDADFRGQCITLAAGSYPSLREMGLNDRVSSVRPAGFGGGGGGGGGNNGGGWGGGGWGGGNAAVELFEHADYDGRSIASTGSPNLARQGFNDKVSSIVIRSGRWEFCSDADYRGACVTLGPGSYGKLGPMNMNDVISSLRPSSGPPSWGGGRPNPGGWAGDDGDAPDVVLAGNRSGRVTFNNGCVVFYNRDGQRFQNLPACHGRQVQRADEAMARHRQDQGMSRPDDEHPWANAPGYGNNDPTPPEIIMGGNREGEVIFRNNCVVYYNAQGRRWRQQPSCSGNQVRRADEAMAAHRREQGY